MSNNEFTIIITRNYYDDRVLFLWDELNLKTGLNVLVGCNGSGKSTFINHLKRFCEKQNIPCAYFDNLSEGGKSRGFENAMFNSDPAQADNFLVSSEGEAINQHMDILAYKIGRESHEDNIDINKPFFILIDALDSGYSIDNILDMKGLFDTILEYEKRNVYIVVAANEYELARGEKCIDVTNGRYISFANYEEYRDFILKSREEKNRLIEESY